MKKIFAIFICGIIAISLNAVEVNAVPDPCIIFPEQCETEVDLGGHSFGTASLLNSSTNSELEEAGDTDYFLVEFIEDTEVSITSTSNLSLKASIYLESSPNSAIGDDFTHEGIGGNFHLDVFTFIANTEYIIVVESSLSWQTGLYTVHIDYGGRSFDDPVTWDVDFDDVFNASIDYNGDIDYIGITYRLEYDVDLYSDTSIDIESVISKTDANHTELASDSNSGTGNNFLMERVTVDADISYVMTIEVESSGVTGAYSVVSDECGCRNVTIQLISPLIYRVYDIFGNAQYQANTDYLTAFEAGIVKYNSMGNVTFSEDTDSTFNDLLVYDIQDEGTFSAIYWPLPLFEDRLEFNSTVMDEKNAAEQYDTVLHELGHSIGLLDFVKSKNILMTYEEVKSNVMTYQDEEVTEFGQCDLEAMILAYIIAIP